MKMFKVLSVMMIVALSAGFTSCGSDDDDNSFDAASLVGTWQATYAEGWIKNSENPKDNETWNGTWAEFEEMETGILMNEDMQFNADGTGKDDLEYDDPDDVFAWVLNGSTLSFIYSDFVADANILELTESKVVIEVSFKDGNVTGYEKVTYKKIK